MAYFTPTFISGTRVTNQQNLLNGLDSRRLFNADGKIRELDPITNPILSMIFSDTSKFGLTDPDINWLEHRPYWTSKYKFYVGAQPTVDTTTYTFGTIGSVVGGGSGNVLFTKVGMTFRVIDADDKTKQMTFRITTRTSDTAIVATRITNSAVFPIAAGDIAYVIGTAFAEGSAKTSGINDIVDVRWNSSQISKAIVTASNTLMKTKLRGGDEWTRLTKNTLSSLWADMERTYLFGERAVSSSPYEQIASYSNTAPLTRQTAGLKQCITWANANGFGNTTVFTPSMATYKYGDLIDNLQEAYAYGNESKIAFCGRGVISFFNKLAQSESMLTFDPNGRKSEFGFKIFDVATAHGTLKLAPHPLLKDDDAYSMFLVDMQNLGIGFLREIELEEDVKTPGDDVKQDQWITEWSTMIALPETHSYWQFLA